MVIRLALLSLALLSAAAVAVGGASAGDWVHFGGDAQVTNDVPAGSSGPIGAAGAARLHTRWTTTLDGPVIASPLYSAGAVPDARDGLVYVATQAGSVYALSAANGSVVWQRSLGTTLSSCGEPQAGVDATYGIVSAGTIDEQRGVLYVIGATGLLHALDLTTGTDAPGWPVQVVTETSGELVWGGLTIAGNQVLVPIASYCDEPAFDGQLADGRLVAVNADTASFSGTFDVVPGPGNMGGIWGYGGASVDPLTGDLWAATGNSWVYDPACDCIREDIGYGEAVVQLDPALNPLASNRPPDVPSLTVPDTDFGATPLLFQPPDCPPLAAVNSKNGFVYVYDRTSLATGPIWSFRAGPDDLDNPFVGEPSYSPDENALYVADARAYDDEGTITHFDAVESFSVGPRCTFPTDEPTWTTGEVGAGPKPPPLVVDDLAVVAGGEVPGVFVLDAGSGAVLWSQELPGAEYAPPAFAYGQIVVADTSGTVTALGIGDPPTPRSFPPNP
ncbi:MAG TPA: PQQ-binding-like beta-propeller repeat protein [Gaiellaceae bacterium]|nr:PQQ-binding-like beta-propeller repeat protein [Gaiellaceae bacterium]